MANGCNRGTEGKGSAGREQKDENAEKYSFIEFGSLESKKKRNKDGKPLR